MVRKRQRRVRTRPTASRPRALAPPRAPHSRLNVCHLKAMANPGAHPPGDRSQGPGEMGRPRPPVCQRTLGAPRLRLTGPAADRQPHRQPPGPGPLLSLGLSPNLSLSPHRTLSPHPAFSVSGSQSLWAVSTSQILSRRMKVGEDSGPSPAPPETAPNTPRLAGLHLALTSGRLPTQPANTHPPAQPRPGPRLSLQRNPAEALPPAWGWEAAD